MGKHARYSPSQWKRWMYCPGSVAFCEQEIQIFRNSEAAEEGTAAHLLLAECMKHKLHTFSYIESRFNDFLVTQEMANNVQVALDYVNSFEGEIHSELEVDPGPALENNEVYGTADIVIDHGAMLEIVDYKHGKGIYYEEKNNAQNILYAIEFVLKLLCLEQQSKT